MNMKYMPGPTISRKTGKNNSDISWGESGLDVFRMEKLGNHMDGLKDEIYPLFDKNRKSLPKNSEIQIGSIIGCWVNCPNELADEVEAIVRRRHDEFRSSKYGK